MAGKDKRAEDSAKRANGSAKRAEDSAKRANGSAADDAEFEKLLDEMDELGRQADALRAKVNHLIDEMRENDVPAEEEVDGASSDEGSAADGEAHDAASSEESGDISVNGHDEAGHNSGEAHVEVEKVNEDDDEDLAMDADTDPAGNATDEHGDPNAA